MSAVTQESTTSGEQRERDGSLDHEVIIIGAGVCGIYQLHRLLELGVPTTVLEAGADLGGTWFWNRYPGARFDSESISYGYSFSPELLQEWDWKERFSGQPENLRYLNYVADKFDLRPHMQFGCTVESATWDDDATCWRLHLDDGRDLSCRFLIMAVGLLSAPTMPRYEGIDELRRSVVPHLQLAGRAGRPGRQARRGDRHRRHRRAGDRRARRPGGRAHRVPAPAELVRPAAQRRRSPAEEMADIKAALRRDLRDLRTHARRVHPRARSPPVLRRAARGAPGEVGAAVRRAGLRHLAGATSATRSWTRRPTPSCPSSSPTRSASRVDDPVVAEKLIPKDHGFGVQRVPMETRYYEAYNRPNVHLVDLNETPIERITPTGVETADGELHELDVIIYATGFDAVTGAYDRIDIRGVDGQSLRDKWADGPHTFLGLQVAGFPNMLMPTGPQSGSASTNFPRGIEIGVDWVTDLLQYMWAATASTGPKPTPRPSGSGATTSRELYGMMLMRKAQGWFTGYNSNVEGHEQGTIRYLVYNGGTPKYPQDR